MPNASRYCVLCKQYDRRSKRTDFTTIFTVEREARLRIGYRRQYNGEELGPLSLRQTVHKKCYNKTVQYSPTTDEPNSSNNLSKSPEHNLDESNEETDQTPLAQLRSRVLLPFKIKSAFERSKHVCVVCNHYSYSYTNQMKRVVSHTMAKKLAKGYAHCYKRPCEKPLFDAYIHDKCQRKLYSNYRRPASTKNLNESGSDYQTENTDQSEITNNESNDLLIEELSSISVPTTNPNIELSAQSCSFQLCVERLTAEQIELHMKQNSIPIETKETSSLTSDQLSIMESSSITQTLTRNNSINDLNQDDNNVCIIESNKEIYPTAEIRYQSTDPLITDHDYISNASSQESSDNLEKLYQWLIKKLKSSKYPIPLSEVSIKYRELFNKDNDKTLTENKYHTHLKTSLENFYPNEFIFIVPNKHDGIFIALNNINYYLKSCIKKSQKEKKEKIVKTTVLSSTIVPPTSNDYQFETCEIVMNAIRRLRLYMHDSKQINSTPPFLIQNFIGLITANEEQYEKISHEYDFYRMINENLFDNIDQTISNGYDKNIRNMSLACDLISARHDYQISQKHYLLADKIANKKSHCKPKKIISLLNRYGHTCSYKSYKRMKRVLQQTTNELNENCSIDEEKSSN